jgi:hypothetical protein
MCHVAKPDILLVRMGAVASILGRVGAQNIQILFGAFEFVVCCPFN